jgi:alkylated DNA repair dioxygenase AlkB
METEGKRKGLGTERGCSEIEPKKVKQSHIGAFFSNFAKKSLWKNIINYEGEVEYLLNFCSSEEAANLFLKLDKEIDWKNEVVKMMGKEITVSRRVSQNGDEGLRYRYSGTVKTAVGWNPLVKELKDRVEIASGEEFNFVLFQYYKDGYHFPLSIPHENGQGCFLRVSCR